MYKITESWQVSCPADVIPAVKVLRDSFAESHWKVGTITQQLTYSVLHDEGEKGIEVNLPRLIELKQIAGPVAAKRFKGTIRIGTPPATFRAFLNLYQDMLTVELIKIFEHLVEIGEANRENLEGNYLDWARQQCLHLVHWEDHHISIWVRECCDVQLVDPAEVRMTAIEWKDWQAPKLLEMTPVHTAPYEAKSAWDRLEVEDSQRLLRHFETYYLLHLEFALKRAWERSMIRVAKRAVRWYCRYGISYRDLEQMMGERGVGVDHSTICRWVQKYAPEIEKRLRWQWRRPQSTSWRVDETYVKVRGKWAYLYRALDKEGNTIDFYLSPTRNAKAAKRFLGKALNGLKAWEKPQVINTDKAPTYGIAISELKAEGKCLDKTVHRQVKYLNNVVEADHGKLKQLIRPVRGFKTLKTAYATIMGFEVMRALRKGQSAIFNLTRDIRGEARIVERAFGIGASALAEAAAMITEQLEFQPA